MKAPLTSLAFLCLATSFLWSDLTKPAWLFYSDFEHPVKNVSLEVYCWISPTAESIEGIFIMKQTWAEQMLAYDPAFRQIMADHNLALVYFEGRFTRRARNEQGQRVIVVEDSLIDEEQVAVIALIADRLADQTGIEAFRTAPLITFGHSAGGPWAQRAGMWNPERILGTISFSSGQSRNTYVNASYPVQPLNNVPSLVMNGELEEFQEVGFVPYSADRDLQWKQHRVQIHDLRAQTEEFNWPISLFVQSGGNHYYMSPEGLDYLDAWIAGIKALRLPAVPGDPLLDLNLEDGWLSDSNIKGETDVFGETVFPSATMNATAAHADYAGPVELAWWHPSEAAALAWDAGNAGTAFTRTRDVITIDQISGGGASQRESSAKLSGQPDRSDDRRVYTFTGSSASGLPVKFDVGPAIGGLTEDPEGVLTVNAALVDIWGTTYQFITYTDGDATTKRDTITFTQGIQKNSGTTQTVSIAPAKTTLEIGELLPINASATSGKPTDLGVFWGPLVVEGDGVRAVAMPPIYPLSTVSARVGAGQWGGDGFRTATAVMLDLTVALPAPLAIPTVTIVRSGETVTLTWSAEPGVSYEVLRGSSPSNVSAFSHSISVLDGEATVVDTIQPEEGDRLFYQVTVSRD